MSSHRSSVEAAFAVSRRNQWGHPGENHAGGGSPVELIRRQPQNASLQR
ncbi:MAG: hypothetical protein ACOX75_07250 [Lachnospiraceae bacterium]